MKNNYKFKYKSLEDPEYIKDKEELFRENGNGWWFVDKSRYQGRRKIKNYTHKRRQ
tara:strand:- start:43 stop:210 length:168 start_codon:yes stop_codon:yes gene_type:complete